MNTINGLQEFDISKELWREYEWPARFIPYRIENPSRLFIRPGGTTHRVVDVFGVVHCVPSVGVNGCVLRWKTKDGEPALNF